MGNAALSHIMKGNRPLARKGSLIKGNIAYAKLYDHAPESAYPKEVQHAFSIIVEASLLEKPLQRERETIVVRPRPQRTGRGETNHTEENIQELPV